MQDKKIRLDQLVCNQFKISRNLSKEYIQNGYIFFNNKVLTKPNLKMNDNDILTLNKTDDVKKEEELIANKTEIKIVYEDEYIFIVDKPSGIIVHPTSFQETNTLANIMKHVFDTKNIKPFGELFRNGIVHRLDKDTSGLLIVAKNQKSYDVFSKMIFDKEIDRKYLALVSGHLKTKTVEVQAPIARIKETNKREVSTQHDAQDATTIFKEIQKYNNFSLVECTLTTGRTHQIRVHAEYINNNILNDPVYGLKHIVKNTKYGQYLVAYKLNFIHPFLNKEITIEIPMPDEFKKYIEKEGK